MTSEGVARYPHVELLELCLEALLVLDNVGVILGRIWNVYKQAYQFVAELFSLVLPVAADDLGFRRDRVELPSTLNNRLADKFVWNRTAIVKP